MDCAGVAGHLVAYLFQVATVSDEERDTIDAHLLECKACLASYFALKRAADRGPLERPSSKVKQRLRAEVAAAFPPKSGARSRSDTRVTLLARRIPLYQGLFAAAVAAAIALVVPTLMREAHKRDVREGAAQIDSARTHAESFQIY